MHPQSDHFTEMAVLRVGRPSSDPTLKHVVHRCRDPGAGAERDVLDFTAHTAAHDQHVLCSAVAMGPTVPTDGLGISGPLLWPLSLNAIGINKNIQ